MTTSSGVTASPWEVSTNGPRTRLTNDGHGHVDAHLLTRRAPRTSGDAARAGDLLELAPAVAGPDGLGDHAARTARVGCAGVVGAPDDRRSIAVHFAAAVDR